MFGTIASKLTKNVKVGLYPTNNNMGGLTLSGCILYLYPNLWS